MGVAGLGREMSQLQRVTRCTNRAEVKDDVLAGLADVEETIRYVQQLLTDDTLTEDSLCNDVLRATATAQRTLSRVTHVLVLDELRNRAVSLSNGDSDRLSVQFEQIVELFVAIQSLTVRKRLPARTDERKYWNAGLEKEHPVS